MCVFIYSVHILTIVGILTSVSDPHPFHADPDPDTVQNLNADPDLGCWLNADPDPGRSITKFW